MFLGSLSTVALILTSASTGTIAFSPEAVVRNDILLLSDVADVSVLPLELRERAAVLPLMKLNGTLNGQTIRIAAIASRARSLLPALAPWLQHAEGTIFIVRRKNVPMQPVAGATRKDGIAKDDIVRVTVTAGIFKVERQTIAMSDAKMGEGMFVRTQEGKALSVICCEE